MVARLLERRCRCFPVLRGRAFGALALTSALAACTGAPGTGAAPPPASLPVDTTWYISARARDEGRDTRRLGETLEYGAVITERRIEDPLEGRIPFRRVDSLLFTREEFVARLRARLTSAPAIPDLGPAPSAFAVLYTHGFATSLHEAWQHTSTSRTRARSAEPWVVFAWPSIGSGISWPRGGDVIGGAYERDSISAVASRGAFASALGAVREAAGGSGTMVVAHSMGGQLVGEVLRADSALRASLAADPLRALAFVAPDVDADRFGDSLVPALRGVTRRLLLYAASDDRVLAVSSLLKETPRAGRFDGDDGTPMVREGLESVDMTDGANSDGLLRRTFGTRHALRRQSAALFDLVHVVGPGFAPACRSTLGTGVPLATGAWRLTPEALPPTSAAARCAPATDAPTVQRAPPDGSTIASTPPIARGAATSPTKVTLSR